MGAIAIVSHPCLAALHRDQAFLAKDPSPIWKWMCAISETRGTLLACCLSPSRNIYAYTLEPTPQLELPFRSVQSHWGVHPAPCAQQYIRALIPRQGLPVPNANTRMKICTSSPVWNVEKNVKETSLHLYWNIPQEHPVRYFCF